LDHQDEYEQLLGSLNQSNGNGAKKAEVVEKLEEEKSSLKSLEQRSMQSKARVHYKKFTRSKDLTNATSSDLNCILGHKKRKQLQEEENGANSNASLNENSDEEPYRASFKLNNEATNNGDKEDTNENSISKMFSTNKMSIGDYFKLKMEEKKNSSKSVSYSSKHTESNGNSEYAYEENGVEKYEENVEEEQAERKKKKKKKKSSRACDEQVIEQPVEEPIVETPVQENEEKDSRRKKKKSKKSDRDETESNGNEVIRSVSIDAIETTNVVEQETELSKADEKRVNDLEFDQLEIKIKESFKGSNLTNILGYSSYVINSTLEEQLREKARKASKKRVIVEKNLEIDANFYNMSKKKKC
jgi:Pin2-interacting protein X1